jgi:hypothetical protein
MSSLPFLVVLGFLEEALEGLVLDDSSLLLLDDSSSSLLLLHSSVLLVFATLLLRRTKPRLQPRDARDQCIIKRGKRMTGRRLRNVQIKGYSGVRILCKNCAKKRRKEKQDAVFFMQGCYANYLSRGMSCDTHLKTMCQVVW